MAKVVGVDHLSISVSDYPASEYYKNYYGVYFEDPDGLELEGMWYGSLKKSA